jgi:hypothetical protein
MLTLWKRQLDRVTGDSVIIASDLALRGLDTDTLEDTEDTETAGETALDCTDDGGLDAGGAGTTDSIWSFDFDGGGRTGRLG